MIMANRYTRRNWRRLVINIEGANQTIRVEMVSVTDEYMGVSQLMEVARAQATPQIRRLCNEME